MIPRFLYDISSPYAYLAATRIERVVPGPVQWQPVSFGVIVKRLAKVPWSFAADRSRDFAEIDRRAAIYGLPPIRYPPGWPTESYSLLPLRALMLADQEEARRRMTMAFFRCMFVDGRALADLPAVAGALDAAGFDGERLGQELESPAVKRRLREQTEAALADGVDGVPTVIVAGRRFWGDDQLPAAAAAAQVSRTGER